MGSEAGAGREAEAGLHDGTSSVPLLARDECDAFGGRLRRAVTGFVDAPRGAVEEADRVVDELADRLAEALTRRRRTLREAWQSADSGTSATTPDTERLRLALRDYRELADRLLHI
ncbi:hypothetical protein [Streptomyces sp. NPDC003697]